MPRRNALCVSLSLCLLLCGCQTTSAQALLIEETPAPVFSVAPAVLSTPTPAPTPEPTPEPTPTPRPVYSVSPAAEQAPSLLLQSFEVFQNGERVDYVREAPLDFGAGEEYARVEGVVTFRGNNYRNGGAYGTADLSSAKLTKVWELKIGAITNTLSGDWTGVGWNGQPVLVRWPEETRRAMNLYEDKKEKDGLVEVIYGTLDGNIYFLDLEDGTPTRDTIDLGYPIKGSVSIHPEGLPLLFVGQGINDRDGHRASRSGWRIYNLIDQSEVFFLDGKDPLNYRTHRLFDSVCIVDAQRDTLIECGENGLVYSIDLNSSFDPAAGLLTLDPAVTTYRYKAKIKEYGIENSPTAYRNYIWFVDNSGLLTCLDTTTMQPLWVRDCTDDADASTVLEEDGENLWLYTGCEVDKQGSSGSAYMRKLNALTGELIWEVAIPCSYADNNGGVLATPTLGRGNMEGLVFFSVCRTKTRGGGILLGLDKQTGEEIWSLKLSRSSWSSPTCVYDTDGNGVLLHADGGGVLRMIEGRTGKVLATADLHDNVEGSPAIFGDMLVVGTRGCKIYGVKIG